MKTALLVIAQKTFRDEEYAEPKRVLETRDVEVHTASTSVGEAVGKLGMVAHADISVANAIHSKWDCVAFIGGAGAANFFDDVDAHALARTALAGGSVVGAICIAPSILAHAGLLDGVRVTAFASQEADVRAHGAIWTGEAVTVDGPIVTADGPQSAREFGERLAELLGV